VHIFGGCKSTLVYIPLQMDREYMSGALLSLPNTAACVDNGYKPNFLIHWKEGSNTADKKIAGT